VDGVEAQASPGCDTVPYRVQAVPDCKFGNLLA